MEQQPYALAMQRELIEEIEAGRPRFIVEVKSPQSWLTRPASHRNVLSWMRRYLEACYAKVGVADAGTTSAPVVRWGEEARDWMPAGDNVIVTYRRTGDEACRAGPAS
jgi:hypothetical protein